MDEIDQMTEDELVEAILAEAQAVEDEGGGYLTTKELMARSHRAKEWVLHQLHKLHDQGRLQAEWVPRTNITGCTQRRVAYRLRKKPQEDMADS